MGKKKPTKEEIESKFTIEERELIKEVATTTPLLLETLIKISPLIDNMLTLTGKKNFQGKTPIFLVQQACCEIAEVLSYDPDSMIGKAK